MAEGIRKNSSAIARWIRNPEISNIYFLPRLWKGCRLHFFVQCISRQPARGVALRDKSTRFNHRIDHDVKPFSTIQQEFLILGSRYASNALTSHRVIKTVLTNIISILRMTGIQSRNNIKGICVTRELHIKNAFRRLFTNS